MVRSNLILSRVGSTLFTAAAMLGLFAVTGFPEPMSRQILIAVGASIAVNAYLLFLDFKRNKHSS